MGHACAQARPLRQLSRKQSAAAQRQGAFEIAWDRLQPIGQIGRCLLMQKRRLAKTGARAPLALAYEAWLEWS
jgi:hypothetical protein